MNTCPLPNRSASDASYRTPAAPKTSTDVYVLEGSNNDIVCMGGTTLGFLGSSKPVVIGWFGSALAPAILRIMTLFRAAQTLQLSQILDTKLFTHPRSPLRFFVP
ncbi:hypothetical protein RRF57_004785 [Xylaria bambusicola]|uniref:Uncharacterized protein n=1 Tax=Xylaria bambusicola TaxID=326684 RepID=A0AAN7UAW7_9PEZI